MTEAPTNKRQAIVDARFLNVGRAVASASAVVVAGAGSGENEKACRKQHRKDHEQQITVFFLHKGFSSLFFSDL